ncbi:MAG TPA: metalloregulator ArsR/SmtB family transcription factor [Mycobacterium sp.]
MLDRSPELRHTGVVKIRTGPTEAAAVAVDAVGAAVPDGQTRRAIVRLLVESGSITAGEIGDRLGLSAAGVRRHLDVLIEAGDAESTAAAAWQQMGRGRPAKRYRLTAAGRAKLDHAYDDLASAAMRQLREIGGEEAVQRFARQRIDSVLAGVAAAASADDADVEAAAERIAAALSKAGFVATTTRVGGPIHGVQICQHHCPVSHVAEEFPELCDAERQAMAEVLGTHVQRLATIVNGDCACTTHVPLTQTATTAPSPRRADDDAERSDAEERRYMTDNTSTKGASL